MKSRELASALGLTVALLAGGKPVDANPTHSHPKSGPVGISGEITTPQNEFFYTIDRAIQVDDGGVFRADASTTHNKVLIQTRTGTVMVVDRDDPTNKHVVLDKDDTTSFRAPQLSVDGTRVIAIQLTEVIGELPKYNGVRMVDVQTGEQIFLPGGNEDTYLVQTQPLENGTVAVVEERDKDNFLGDATVTVYNPDGSLKIARTFPFELTAAPSGVYKQAVYEMGGKLFFMRGSSSYILNPDTLNTEFRSSLGFETFGISSSSLPSPQVFVEPKTGLIIGIERSPYINFQFVQGDAVTVYDASGMVEGRDPELVERGMFNRYYGKFAGTAQIFHVDGDSKAVYLAGYVVTNPDKSDADPVEFSNGVLRVTKSGKVETLHVGEGHAGGFSMRDACFCGNELVVASPSILPDGKRLVVPFAEIRPQKGRILLPTARR